MGLFRKKHSKKRVNPADAAALALRSLDFINEAVMVVNDQGMIKFANPAASAMTGFGDPDNVTGLDYNLVIHLEDIMGNALDPTQTELYTAINLNRAMHSRSYVLVSTKSERRTVLDLSCIPTGDEAADRIITFRDITNEVAEEREQAEFISTASHEMRTPVASIEGYLGLALNPQTATIDERAKKYLEAAHASSQHLGRLFKDLLDVTKFDDDRAKLHLIPVDAIQAVAYIANEQSEAIQAKHINYSFGQASNFMDKKHLAPKIFMAVDYDFLREIVNNLLGNAIKYTPDGGEIKISVRGDSDQVIISVADNGIGIPSDDLVHIFQKFYRVDNSQTRQIGGTGLGLYLVKRRAEAMGGRVWAESEFGHGSVFYVALPRITESEYEKMRIAYGNEKMIRTPFVAPVVGTVPTPQPNAGGLERTVTGLSEVKIQPLNQSSQASSMPTSSVVKNRQMFTNPTPEVTSEPTPEAPQILARKPRTIEPPKPVTATPTSPPARSGDSPKLTNQKENI